jgi:hypothetical protein
MSSSIRNAASLFATAASLLLLPAVVQAQSLCPNCTIPSGESTTAYRQDGLSPYYPTVEDFVQTVSGGTAPSGTQIAEASAQTGSDTCWSKYSPYSAVLYTSGGYWPIGTASPTNEQSFVSVGPNQWGPDLVGYLGGPARWYLVYNPQYGKSIPCGFTIYQSLYYICPNGVETGYGYAHALTSTITTSGVQDCRADISNNRCSPVLANTDSLPGDPSGPGGTGGGAVMGNASDDYLRQGVITHTGAHAVVAVDQPRPLYSAVHTIREEYGWLVDYEDPRYDSQTDLKDATSPHWRASHPESPATDDR